jgi:putative peptidoglycan lipid II flippase
MHHAHVTLARFDLSSILGILGGFALGLVGFSAYLFILRAFYARTDTRTPFYLNLVENALNIVFAVVLVGRYGVLGLAIAYALAYTFAAIISFVVLVRRLDGFDVRGLVGTLLRLLVAAGVMAFVAAVIAGAIEGRSWGPVLASLAATIGTGIVTYAGAVLVLRIPEQMGAGDTALRMPDLFRRSAGRGSAGD